jgi:hypothetical protein
MKKKTVLEVFFNNVWTSHKAYVYYTEWLILRESRHT